VMPGTRADLLVVDDDPSSPQATVDPGGTPHLDPRGTPEEDRAGACVNAPRRKSRRHASTEIPEKSSASVRRSTEERKEMGYEIGTLALGPVFALQGRYVRRTTPRLPEASGDREGTRGEGRPLRLLLLGDSAAAGVGAGTQEEALSGRLVTELANTFRVSWMLIARAGATTSGTSRHLSRRPSETFDVAVVSLGGNDVLARRPMSQWLTDLDLLADSLRARFGVRHLLFSGIPPMHLFPGFPQPLRWYLGATARRFDDALARWSAGRPDCEHVPLELKDGAGLLAPDGMHPGPLLYERWGALLAPRIRARYARP